jgi:hypothetical protein
MKLHYNLGDKAVSQKVDSIETASALAVIVEDRHGATSCYPYHDDGTPACGIAQWLDRVEGAKSTIE